MLYKLSIEIIELIASDDLYIQSIFCKLKLYNYDRFIKN